MEFLARSPRYNRLPYVPEPFNLTGDFRSRFAFRIDKPIKRLARGAEFGAETCLISFGDQIEHTEDGAHQGMVARVEDEIGVPTGINDF